MAKRHVHPHASVVDPLVDTVVRKLGRRQRPQALTDRPHRPHVLSAVLEQVLHVLLGVLEGRHAALPHERRAAMVLLHAGTREPTNVLQRARRTVGARLRGGAIELLQTRLGHLEVRAEHIPEDEPLEGGVMGGDGVQILDTIPHGCRERLVGRPDLHVRIIDRPSHAEHPRARVLSVGVRPASDQVALGARLEVDPDHWSSRWQRGPKPPSPYCLTIRPCDADADAAPRHQPRGRPRFGHPHLPL